jgi:hypothetical protein
MTNAVIDKNILGWGDKHSEEILRKYEKIIKVGEGELPQRIVDQKIASYCKENDCDLFTADSTAYIHYFEAGIHAVKITQYDWIKEGDNPVFLIQII